MKLPAKILRALGSITSIARQYVSQKQNAPCIQFKCKFVLLNLVMYLIPCEWRSVV